MTSTGEDLSGLTDRALAELNQHQLNHIDGMLHALEKKLAALDPLIPLIPRVLAMLDPASSWRARRAARTGGNGHADIG
jgi:hypothetical protein